MSEKLKENCLTIQQLYELGNNEFKNRNFKQSKSFFCKIFDLTNLNKIDGKLCYQIGILMKEDFRDYELAIQFWQKTIELAPEFPNSYWFIGDIYARNLKNSQLAIKYFEKYIEIAPPNAEAYRILAGVYEDMNCYENLDVQIKYLNKAKEIQPKSEEVLRDLAHAYSRAQIYDKCFETFQELFKINATMEDYFVYACRKLKLGDFKEGFKYYESRFYKDEYQAYYPTFTQPKWRGEVLTDKTLLVQYEQGCGDSIQFFRYLDVLVPVAKKIIFRSRSELYQLLKQNTNNIEIIEETLPIDNLKFDFHIPLMNIPCILPTTKENIPSSKGYLTADKTKVDKFKQKFFNNNYFKIGIAWHGTNGGYKNRNIPIEAFEPLTKLSNVKIYSFQKNDGEEQLYNWNERSKIINLSNELNDFSDTAAAMKNLDLLITSDNGNVHLSGALGVKTFLLLDKNPEWRWFLDEEKTPWYDSIRIFKKKTKEQTWLSIVENIAKIISNKNHI